jgi:ribonuclease III
MTNIEELRTTFKDKLLLDQALTHRSWINENPGIRGTNERLEFLGDAILEFIVSDAIYKRLPEKEEGYLTALRANLVNTVNLASVAGKLNIGPDLFLSKGEDEGGGRANPSLLADTVEAIIGALYIDQGLSAAREFIESNVLVDLEERVVMPLKDPKSSLQEKVQAQGSSTPRYKVAGESGPDHAKVFVVEVIVDGKVVGSGQGRSKSEAEQEAAKSALAVI